MPEPSTVEPKQCQRQFPCPSCRCILDAGHTGRCDEHCGQPPLSDLGERPVDLDLSHAVAPSGPFAELVADKRVTLTAQAALGRLLAGDTERTAKLLRELDVEALARVELAADNLRVYATGEIIRQRAEALRYAPPCTCGALVIGVPHAEPCPRAAAEPATPPALRNAPGTGDPDAGTGTPDTAEAATAGCICGAPGCWTNPCRSTEQTPSATPTTGDIPRRNTP